MRGERLPSSEGGRSRVDPTNVSHPVTAVNTCRQMSECREEGAKISIKFVRKLNYQEILSV